MQKIELWKIALDIGISMVLLYMWSNLLRREYWQNYCNALDKTTARARCVFVHVAVSFRRFLRSSTVKS